jgi:GntR family transcriptional regulator, transcriptional repressor for pyruvate dehydrogenase complex
VKNESSSSAGHTKPPVQKKLQKVTRTSLSDNIAQQVMALISTDDLKPGQRLPAERELCKYFGVGRSSLREAIRCLAMIGILDVSIGNGTFVAASAERFVGKIFQWRMLTEQHAMQNLMEVRLALECAASARAAMCGTEEQFSRLEGIVKRMQRNISQPKRFIKLDLEYHVLLAEASNNKLLFDLLFMIRNQLSAAMLTFVTMPGGAALACKHHRSLLKVLQARDAKAARSIMHTHLALSWERYRTVHVSLTDSTGIE